MLELGIFYRSSCAFFAGKGLDTYLAILIPVGIIGNFFSFMVKYFHLFITVIMLPCSSV